MIKYSPSIPPVSPLRFVAQQLAKQQKEASEKWGFDFVNGHPIEDQTKFEWTCTISPAVYTLTHAAHVIESNTSRYQSDSDDNDDLLDERMERSGPIFCDNNGSLSSGSELSSPDTVTLRRSVRSSLCSPRSTTVSRTSGYNSRSSSSSSTKSDAKRQPKITGKWSLCNFLLLCITISQRNFSGQDLGSALSCLVIFIQFSLLRYVLWNDLQLPVLCGDEKEHLLL